MLVFLFTDIEGSTRLWEEDTAEMGTVIACHSEILREEVRVYRGGTTKHTGDHSGTEGPLGAFVVVNDDKQILTARLGSALGSTPR